MGWDSSPVVGVCASLPALVGLSLCLSSIRSVRLFASYFLMSSSFLWRLVFDHNPSTLGFIMLVSVVEPVLGFFLLVISASRSSAPPPCNPFTAGSRHPPCTQPPPPFATPTSGPPSFSSHSPFAQFNEWPTVSPPPSPSSTSGTGLVAPLSPKDGHRWWRLGGQRPVGSGSRRVTKSPKKVLAAVN
jgi:hypothetical protein